MYAVTTAIYAILIFINKIIEILCKNYYNHLSKVLIAPECSLWKIGDCIAKITIFFPFYHCFF